MQAYWRKSRVKEVPAPEQLDAVLSFLEEQGVRWQWEAFPLQARVGLSRAVQMMHVIPWESKRSCFMSAGVEGEHMPPALQRFPEVLALDVERQLRANIETLQSTWFVRGLALKKLLRSQPQVRRSLLAPDVHPAVALHLCFARNEPHRLLQPWRMPIHAVPPAQVLGYNVDCGGNCQGDCNRCWVRF